MQYKDLEIQSRKDFASQESKRGVWKRCTFEADPALWHTLQDEAREAGCSVSELIRAIVSKWCCKASDTPTCLMDENTYETELARAAYFMRCDTERAPFWGGYHKGLHRAHDGDSFCDEKAHEAILALSDYDDPDSRMRGDGYRAGLDAVRTGMPWNDEK